MFVITVKGEIIANDKNHYAQEWACRTMSPTIKDNTYNYDPRKRIVRNNLILNKKIRAVPYAAYFSENEISVQSTGEIIMAPGAMAAELYYKDNISEIEDLFNFKIPSEIEVFFYNGLLTGIFSVLELFLSDVLLCLIFTNSDVYDRALAYMKDQDRKNGKKTNYMDQDLTIQQYFTKGIVYHQFDKVKIIFKRILQIALPDPKNIQYYLHKRNNITHRFAFSNLDRMEMTVINVEILNEFILCCNEFVENIMKRINIVYTRR